MKHLRSLVLDWLGAAVFMLVLTAIALLAYRPALADLGVGAVTMTCPNGNCSIPAPAAGSALTINALFGTGGYITASATGNAGTTADFQNLSSGSSAYTAVRTLNASHAAYWGIASTGATSGFWTGGPAAEHLFLGSPTNIPLSIGVNNAEVLRVTSTAVTSTQPVQLKGFTVATLPSCVAGLAGALAYVTDATAPTYNTALTGGGAVVVPVFCSGSAWTSH